MAKHPLESKDGLSSAELLDAINARFRLKVAVEGAVAEFQMSISGHSSGPSWNATRPTTWTAIPTSPSGFPAGPSPCLPSANIRESGKEGGEAYREGGKIVAYKVETQKTRAATGDPTSRYYGIEQYHILGVCLGKKTGDWTDFLFARTIDLVCHAKHSHKLAVFQRVPLPDAANLQPGKCRSRRTSETLR